MDNAKIKQIVEKYVHSLTREPANIPDIKNVIAEALKDVAPERVVDEASINSVLEDLYKRPIVNDKTIHEAAKKVADHGATEDLRFTIDNYIKQLKPKNHKSTPKDAEEIIKQGKLDPYTSTPFQIKNAVRDFFAGPRPLETVSQEEIQDVIKSDLAKHGPVDERDIRAVLKKYMDKADPEKSFRSEDIRTVVQAYIEGKPKAAEPKPEPIERPESPHATPINRPEAPSAEPLPKGNVPLPPRTGKSTIPVKAGAPVPPKDPSNTTMFEKIRAKMRRYGIKALSRQARNWLNDTVRDVGKKPNRNKILTEGTIQEAFIGKMFMYFYQAKHDKDLPYWDKFPLIFVIELYKDGWLGINLHYLPMVLRMKLFDKLLEYANDTSLDQITKLKLSYALLGNFAQFPEVQPCIKRYLSEYVKSDLVRVEAVDWEIALFLPVEQFQKQPKEHVWKESKSKVRGK